MVQAPPPVVNHGPSTVSVSGWAGVPLVVALLAVAWIAVAGRIDDALILPGPWTVLAALPELLRNDAFPGEAIATLRAAGIGFAAAVVVGALAGGGFAASAPLRLGALVLVAVPVGVLVPLGIVWFGLGETLATACAASFALTPVLAGFALGGVARSAGLAVGVTMALNGTLMAEFFGVSRGLGHLMMDAVQTLDMPQALSVAILLLALAIAAVLIVHAVASLVLSRNAD